MDYCILGDVKDYEELEKLYTQDNDSIHTGNDTDLLENNTSKLQTAKIEIRLTKPAVTPTEPSEWLKRMHIFQRYRYLYINTVSCGKSMPWQIGSVIVEIGMRLKST